MPKSSYPLHKLLEAVKSEVEARLKQSLHNAVLLNLCDETQPNPMQRIWDVEVKIGKRPPFQLPLGVSITQVFEQTGGRLLIMGAMGSGKTTTLLELAQSLIIRAEKKNQQPIPIVFEISSWQNPNQTLIDWFVTELKLKYNVPDNIGKQLINEQQLLPLIDGIDELDLINRERCLQAINQLLAEANQSQRLVVCTRLEEYKSCKTKLRLNGAIYLRPLTDIQIRDYMLNARSRELWYGIKDEPNLLALARTPLLLSMMTLAYEEILIQAWRRLSSKEERYQYLLNAFIRRMLAKEIKSRWSRKDKEIPPEQTRPWLVFLAKRMKPENQTEFALQDIQPNWLQEERQKWMYRIGVGLTLGGIGGLKSLILRFILWQNGYIPWNYTRFLNDASERLFLQRIDGRYRFIHEILRNHFAQ